MTVSISIIAAAMLQSTTTFNLDCVGTVSSYMSNYPSAARTQSYRGHFVVDLGRNLYCEETCDSPRTIGLVQPSDIYFEAGGSVVKRLNRISGQYTAQIRRPAGGGVIITDIDAVCTKAEYTPIPQPVF